MHCLCYMPTWSLTYSITFAHLQDPAREFPIIRTMSVLGWIAASLISPIGFYAFGIDKIEETTWPLKIAAALCIFTGIYNLFLPRTPPPAAGKKVTIGELLGLNALGLLKDPNFTVFMAASLLIMIPGCFYWNYYNDFLVDIKMPFPQLVQSHCTGLGVDRHDVPAVFLAPHEIQEHGFLGLLAWCARTCVLRVASFRRTSGPTSSPWRCTVLPSPSFLRSARRMSTRRPRNNCRLAPRVCSRW